MRLLSEQENLLIGKIVFNEVNNMFELDEQGKRIEYLISNYLIKVKSDESGWFVLYKDPMDGRFWELSYPNSEQEGGGAPTLILLKPNSIEMEKYRS